MSIRVLALAIIQRGDGKFLVERGEDKTRNEVFYRCMGGGVEFRERGQDAVARELKEETGKEVVVEKFLGVVENIFEWNGAPGHQIILFYKCRFSEVNDAMGEKIQRIDVNGSYAFWRSLDDMKKENALFHPHQVLSLLEMA